MSKGCQQPTKWEILEDGASDAIDSCTSHIGQLLGGPRCTIWEITEEEVGDRICCFLEPSEPCPHAKLLMKGKIYDTALITNMKTDEQRFELVLRELIESKQGKLSVTTKSGFVVVRFCVLCGLPVKEGELVNA